MRRRTVMLWITVCGTLAAPIAALTVRMRDERDGARRLASGVAVLDTPLERSPVMEPALVSRALADFDVARHTLHDATEGRRARALWHTAQAMTDLLQGDVILAQQESDTAVQLMPGEPHAVLVQAQVAVRRGERPRAERLLANLERSPSVGARASVLRVELLLDGGRAHEALAAAETLDRGHPTVAAVKNLLGLSRAAVGDRVGAREAFDAALRIDGRAGDPLVNIARLQREAGDREGAKATLERAMGVAPEHAGAWLAYGTVLAEMGDVRAARPALVRAGQLAGDDAAPWVAQGNLDLAEGNFANAAESFRQALARDEDDATARTNLGVSLARQGQRNAAREAFEQATRHAPHQGEAWNGLGAMRLSLNDAEGAVAALQQASVLLPGDPNPPMNMGLALERLQRWDDAARAYREVLRRSPEHEGAMRRLMALTPAPDRPRELRRVARLVARNEG